MRLRLPGRLALAAVVLLGGVSALPQLATGMSRAATAAPVAATSPGGVTVKGNALLDSTGRPLRLLGVNRSGSEYACVQGWGIFDGPVDTAAVAAIRQWHVNAVRVPLNEHCWLGINGVAPSLSGAAYRDAVTAFVARLNAAGLVAVLDLHWSAAGTTKATDQQVMANADHSPAFWTSVAATFRGTPGVVFDLFNEPHDISWSCWRDGCTTAQGWRAAGMQTLLDAVRATGALQPVLVSGNDWGGDLSGWLAHRPADRTGQVVASAHIYSFSGCSTATCWDATLGPVADAVPVVTAEFGEQDCTGAFARRYMDWADAHGVGYLGWTWNTWDCGTGPALVSSYDGTPTGFGRQVRDRFATLAGSPPPPSPTPTTGTPTLVQGFEVAWVAETPRVRVAPSTVAHSGRGGLAVTGPAVTADSAVLRVNSGGVPLDRAAGELVTGWVKVPRSTTGTRWRAQLQLQDGSWTWHGGAQTPLVPGTWTQITYRPAPAEWAGNHGVGVQFVSSQTGAGPQLVHLDEVEQVG